LNDTVNSQGKTVFQLLISSLFLLLAACNQQAEPTDHASPKRPFLSARFLLGDEKMESPAPTTAYRAVVAASPSNQFEGTLELQYAAGLGQATAHVDRFDQLNNTQLNIPELPPFQFDFIQDGSDLIPLSRGTQASDHPYWEFILEPGTAWDEVGDDGYTRASIPFSLQERNANCTHNGLMTFLFKSDGSMSRIAYQVGSETCFYLQLDLWGLVPARYHPKQIADKEAIVSSFRKELASRLPLRPFSALAEDYPGTDLSMFRLHDPAEVTTYGFVIDDIHYSGGCETRYGPYPHCEVLDLPSYSLAKSVFAGTALAWLEAHYPGAGELLVTDYVPECRNDDRWTGVTLEHLVDMATGNYSSTDEQVDEFASYKTDFMGSERHLDKIQTACSLFPHQSEPGSQFVYHTSDTYIAGTLINAFLREQPGFADSLPDIHRDILVEEIMKPLSLSPVTWKTRRTYDEMSQPFAGFGLTFHSDDIARFALFLMSSDGLIGGEQIIDRSELDAALQRDPSDPGLNTGTELFRYNNGFWAHDVQEYTGCSDSVWIPLMSGYGGISIVLMPNNSVYYVFSDGGHFEWAKAAVESNNIHKYCE
jgi:hypothetical protein